MKTNYYHLTKKELSFISSIEKPFLSTRGVRLSRPVVVVRLGDMILHVWTLKWFRYKVKQNLISNSLVCEIYAMY